MYNTKLIKLLSAFKANEIYRLGQFVESSLFTHGRRPQMVKALVKHIISFYPQFEKDNISKYEVYQTVFPDEEFNKSKLDKLSTEAVAVVQEFIALFCSDVVEEPKKWLNQARFYKDRGMDSEFRSALKKYVDLLEKMPKDQKYFLGKFNAEYEYALYQSDHNNKKDDVNLTALIKSLDLFYISHKLEFCSHLLSQNFNTSLEMQQSTLLLEEILKVVRSNYLDVPLLSTYYYTCSLLLQEPIDDYKSFDLLNKDLKEHGKLISNQELSTIHYYMRSFLANRYINGDEPALKKLFLFIKEHVNEKTIYQDGEYILASTLQNAITVALKLNETSWAMNFLTQHKDRIKGADDAKSIYQFNLANILFHQCKYQEAQRQLEKFHFREMFYNLAARRLGIKLDYETKLSLDVFEYRLKALKSFVFEQKKILPKDKFDSNNNFVKLLMQVFTILQEDYSRSFMSLEPKAARGKRIGELTQKVRTEKTIAEREWLLEKLEELKS